MQRRWTAKMVISVATLVGLGCSQPAQSQTSPANAERGPAQVDEAAPREGEDRGFEDAAPATRPGPPATPPEVPAEAPPEAPGVAAPAQTGPLAQQADTEAPEPPAAEEPTPAKGDAADATPEAASEAEVWLERIEAATKDIQTFEARLRFDTVAGLLGDMTRRFGRLVYDAGPPARFVVHFDKLLVDDVVRQQDRYWVFDGKWLVERLDDKKQFFKRQIVGPGTPPERADPLALGEGPFPLPIRANKAEILRRFRVELIEGEDDPNDKALANTVRLRLHPRRGQDMDADYLDVWWERDHLTPVQIAAVKEASEDMRVFRLLQTVVNPEIDPAAFDTTPPKGEGWMVEITPWRE